MNLNLKNINITIDEDWEMLKEEWNDYFDNELSFSPYHKLLSKLNIIVGFGRGFWRGVDGYFYLVYHKENQRFYWYLRNNESDTDIYFYEVDEHSGILELLRTKSYEENFAEFDVELNFGTLYLLSIGETNETSGEMSPVPLSTLFGEDTEQLRIALMYFYPGSYGSKYPHKEFLKRFFLPAYQQKIDEKIQSYNKGSFNVFRKGDSIYIQLQEDIYELKKVEK
ncbi:hypothetical protein MZM54_00790 [[Brevibacterium] frigoritolerans]|nr:hypothetical protein [Peribacillus frigoritolerans]